MRRAFTMVELVFVIVVLGILAGIAIPKMMATRTDAQVAKGRSVVAGVRSGIVNERQIRLFRGDNTWAPHLDDATTAAGQTIFDGNATNPILMYGVITSSDDGHWIKTNTDVYDFKAGGKTARFTYYDENGSFNCVDQVGTGLCADLTK